MDVGAVSAVVLTFGLFLVFGYFFVRGLARAWKAGPIIFLVFVAFLVGYNCNKLSR